MMRWGASPLAGSSASRADCVASKQLPAFVTYVWILLDLVFGFFFSYFIFVPPLFLYFVFFWLSLLYRRPSASSIHPLTRPLALPTRHVPLWRLGPAAAPKHA